jgi:hypothetical protein
MLDKKSKKGDIRKREFSEPILTPKGHTKIDNEQKIIVKNSSIVNFDKKKGREREKEREGIFKKKTKKDIVIS